MTKSSSHSREEEKQVQYSNAGSMADFGEDPTKRNVGQEIREDEKALCRAARTCSISWLFRSQV